MDDGFDVRVLGEDPVDQGAVRDVALVEGPALCELPPAGDQVVEDDGVIPASEQADATVLPMYPAPPAIRTFMPCLPL